jgi:cytidylate kinase
MIIAIDGPAGAGKSTVARRVAQQLGFAYIDTGAMYRAVALVALEHNWTPEIHAAQIAELGAQLPLRFGAGGTQLFVDERDVSGAIRSPEIGSLTSQIATLAKLRECVAKRQRELGTDAENTCGGAVLEGRDIQTVVFPGADLKVFLTATDQARAQRRLNQWQEKQQPGDLESALRDIVDRDARDSGRETSPLQAAPDAVHLLTDDLTPDEVVERIVELARERQKVSSTKESL